MNYFQIKYMLSGRYSSKIIAQILRWENGHVTIKDQNGRLHDIKESYITSINAIHPKERNKHAAVKEYHSEQGTLFHENDPNE